MTRIKDRAAQRFFRLRCRFKDKSRLTESIFRIGEMYFHFNWFNGLPLEQVFSTIYDSSFWQCDESKSGIGSSIESTVVIRDALPEIIREYSIQSILDVPCGDYNWMKNVNMTCDYIGGDIVADLVKTNNDNYGNDKIRFVQIDITRSELPKVDLIFCRDCLQHLSYDNIFRAFKNFKRSGAKYILVTSYPCTLKNWDISDGNYFPLNLRKAPFRFPKPIKSIKEKAPKNEIDKTMLLYRLDDIPTCNLKTPIMLSYDQSIPILLVLPGYYDGINAVWDKIRTARPSKLYISGSKSELNKITDSIDWGCRVKTLCIEESSNGPFSLSVDWFFKNEKEGIVLEKSFIPSDDFFGFCSQLLKRYRDDKFVARINGGLFADRNVSDEASYRFSSLPDSYAWAGWRDKSLDQGKVTEYIKTSFSCNIFANIPSTEPFAEYLYAKMKSDLDSGNTDRIQYAKYWIDDLITGRVYITPNIPMCENLTEIGIKKNDGCATQEGLTHPDPVMRYADYKADIRTQENLYDISVTDSIPDGYFYLKELCSLPAAVQGRKPAIPRIIHQIYEDPTGPPDYLLTISESWKEQNPEWEYRFWDKKAIERFLKENFPDFIPVYNNLKYNVQRWDTIRYLILYHTGGLYADMDYECIEPIEPLLVGTTCCMGMEPTIYSRKYDRPLVIGNALMASAPKHLFMERIVNHINENHDKQWNESKPHQILESTGPLMVSRVYESLSEDERETVTLIPADLVAPLTKTEVQMYLNDRCVEHIERKLDRAFAVHYFMGSWLDQLFKNNA